MRKTFTVKALWDEEAQIFVSESDIIGLHIEAETLEEFEAIMHDVAGDLIAQNHYSARELASTPIKDLIPAILWQRPDSKIAFA